MRRIKATPKKRYLCRKGSFQGHTLLLTSPTTLQFKLGKYIGRYEKVLIDELIWKPAQEVNYDQTNHPV